MLTVDVRLFVFTLSASERNVAVLMFFHYILRVFAANMAKHGLILRKWLVGHKWGKGNDTLQKRENRNGGIHSSGVPHNKALGGSA